MRFTRTVSVVAVAVLLGAADVAPATRVKDVTHFKGRRGNEIFGMGLVVGLPGTGDGGKYLPSIMQLQSLLSNFNAPVPAAALSDTKNVAIVWVSATLPENGVREGDAVDVRIESIGAAKALIGGMLVSTPLQSHDLSRTYAFARGPMDVQDPKVSKTRGIIRKGAVMEADVIHSYVDEQRQITLVVEDAYASWSWADAIAVRINEDASEFGQRQQIARALDPKNIVVTIPEVYADDPAPFIAGIENVELALPPGEARVIINRRTGTIIIGADVVISPAVISHNGMSIMTVQPPVKPTAENPVVDEEYATGIHAPKDARGGAKLRELVDALNQLNVPAKDIIEIVENLHRAGHVKGKLEFRD